MMNMNTMIALRAAHAIATASPDNNPFSRLNDNTSVEAHTSPQNSYFYGIIPLFQRFLYWFSIFVVLLTTSITIYSIFYVTIMPAPALTKELYFDYTTAANPTAIVEILAQHSLWEAFVHDIQPSWTSKHHKLTPKQAYFLEIDLELPESNHNVQGVGMFGVIVELYAIITEEPKKDEMENITSTPTCHNNKMIARSVRSARFPHESRWIGVLRKLILMIPLLIGGMVESKWITVPSYRYYIEHKDYSLTQVRVVLEGKPYPEVLRGQVRIGKELNWFQNLLKEWFWTCSTLGVACVMVYEIICYFVLSFVWRRWMRRHQVEEEWAEPYYFSASDNDNDEAMFGQHQEDGFGGDYHDENMWEAMSQQETPATEAAETTPTTTTSAVGDTSQQTDTTVPEQVDEQS